MASLQPTVILSGRARGSSPVNPPSFVGLRRSASSPVGMFGLSIDPRSSFQSFIAKENTLRVPKIGVVQAAWTRRSRGEPPKKPRKSWGQRTEMYMKPFLLNVFFSKRYIHAKVMHRGTSKVISNASTNAQDLRNTLPSLIDDDACRVVGKLIAERSKDADVFAITYDPRKGERVEGRLGIVLDTIKENGIIILQ